MDLAYRESQAAAKPREQSAGRLVKVRKSPVRVRREVGVLEDFQRRGEPDGRGSFRIFQKRAEGGEGQHAQVSEILAQEGDGLFAGRVGSGAKGGLGLDPEVDGGAMNAGGRGGLDDGSSLGEGGGDGRLDGRERRKCRIV